jgi:GNAT superfamily N-acetyltransferase
MKIEVVEKPDQALVDFFETRLAEFNAERWEVKVKVPIVVRVTNDKGEITAGCAGKTFGSWLMIDNLWVREDMRGHDLGSKILAQIESAAKARGVKYVLLDTLNFQARPFYEKHGYKVQWTQEHYPRDGRKFFMSKEL